MKSYRTQSIRIFALFALLSLFPCGSFLSRQASAQEATGPDQIQSREAAPAADESSAPGEFAEQQESAGEIPVYTEGPIYRNSRDRVQFGNDQRIRPDENVNDLVTIFGSAQMEGKVEGDMVTIFGNAEMTGSVSRDMVTIFGDVEINGPVNRDLVVVFGSLTLGPNAVLGRDSVTIFGKMNRDPGAVVAKDVMVVLPQLSGLKDYFLRGPLMGRLLPPGSLFAWIVVALHFVLYFLVALVLPKPTAATVRQLDESPLLCFGVGLLTMILLAPLNFILVVTGIGIILVPLVGLAHIAFTILGKTAVLQYFGLGILRRSDTKPEANSLLAFLIGFSIVTVVYMIPIAGALLWILLGPFALGAAVMAIFRSIRKNGNGDKAAGVVLHPQDNFPGAPEGSAGIAPPNAPTGSPEAGGTMSSTSAPSPSSLLRAEPLVLPRAGFWIRLAATALDAILLTYILVFTGKLFILFWVTYHVAMWTWKGTTIGGIICRLKVVRLDGRQVDFGAALVRSLAAFFSAVALGLGFFWVGWTREKQSWHDMIAGTVIARVPQSIHLV